MAGNNLNPIGNSLFRGLVRPWGHTGSIVGCLAEAALKNGAKPFNPCFQASSRSSHRSNGSISHARRPEAVAAHAMDQERGRFDKRSPDATLAALCFLPIFAMTPAPHPSRRFGFTWLWVLVPFLFTLWLSLKWTPDFPHADHWGLESGVMLADAEDRLTWDVLAAQMNDSRYLLTRVCALAIGRATHWNVRMEAAACVVMAGAIAVMAWWMARRTIAGRAADVAGGIIALFILTPHQVMNWNFGVQICYFLPIGAAVGIAAVFLTRWTLARQTAAGILLATAGAWSFAPGWLGWGLVLWGILGWCRRTRPGAVGLALAAAGLALAANLACYFQGYHFQEETPLAEKVVVKAGAVLGYFLDLLGAGFAEGWIQSNQAGRGRMLDVLGPLMGGGILLWLGVLALLHRRDLQRRTGNAPAWMWTGLTGWALLVVATVAAARTGLVVSHPFASRYLAFSLLVWGGAVALTLLLPPGRARRRLLWITMPILLWGWSTGVLTGVKYLQREGYTMRLLQGALTMSLVAPEPQGLRGNDPHMHTWLPMARQLDDLGYIRPPLLRSPLVSDAAVQENPLIEGELGDITPGPPLRVSGYAIDHRRSGPADSVVLSYQAEGGAEIWWTPVTGRTVDKPYKQMAKTHGLAGEHARIGWEWEAGQDPTNYQVVTLPSRPCTIRAYVLDGQTGIFYRLSGEKQMVP